MNRRLIVIIFFVLITVLSGCGNTYQADKMNINDYSTSTMQNGKTNVDVPLTITVNKNEYENLQQENDDLEKENEDLKNQISELKESISQLEEKVNGLSSSGSDSNNTIENTDTKTSNTNENNSISYLSDIEDIGIQGEGLYCFFDDFKNNSKDNIGEYHNNGLIFRAKNSVTDILSKSYYNNGKYKTISGTVALAQSTKDTKSTAILRIYGINNDQSIETVFTSKEFTTGIVPELFNDIDISQYESVKIEVTFNEGDPTAIGLYDAYFK